MVKEITYIHQLGNNCVVSYKGARHVIQNCNAQKLENTLLDRLGPKYTSREMYKFGFIPSGEE